MSAVPALDKKKVEIRVFNLKFLREFYPKKNFNYTICLGQCITSSKFLLKLSVS